MKNILKTIALSFVLAAAISSCDKPYEIDKPLALTQKLVELKATVGETPVAVYSNGSWTASLTKPVNWAGIDRVEGYGLGEVRFTYAANYGLSRSVGIIIKTEEKVDTIMMVQAAGQTNPEFHFNNPSYTFAKTPDRAALPFTSNIPYNLYEAEWTVNYPEGTEEEDYWISEVEIKNDSVVFNVAQNFESADRSAVLKVSHTDAAGKTLTSQVELIQGKLDPYLSFDASITGGEVNFSSTSVLVPVESNLIPYLFKIVKTAQISYVGTEKDWVTKVVADPSNGGVLVYLKPNASTEPRKVTITMTYVDGNGSAPKVFKLNLTQSRYVKSWTFEEIKNLIPGSTGEYTFTDHAMIDGVVIGDKDSKNMEYNPMDPSSYSGLRGMIMDYQDKFTYIQAEDGSHGFRVQFDKKQSNTLSRYSKVKINLKGVKVVKEADPARYTLEGVTIDCIVSVAPGIAAKRKVRELKDLTDNDVFTYTTIQDMEITFKRGCYTNLTDGYTYKTDLNPMGNSSSFVDAYPLNLRDRNGNVIYMVTNSQTPWRRTGNGVPQGSGNISGIIIGGTNPMMERYVTKGNLGKYAIRVLEESDIDFYQSRFTNVLVEWDWNVNTVASTILEPTTGEGKLFCNISTATGLTGDYNDLVSTGSGKGVINGACRWSSSYWWGATDADAPYFQIEFSTKDVTGSTLVYNWAVAQGNGSKTTIFAPVYWHLEYSTDGTTFTKLDKEYAVRPIVWWDNAMSLTAIPGLTEYTAVLPSSLFGQDKVYLRFIASSKEAATLTTPDGGTVQDTGSTAAYIRFGEMSVLYN